MDINQEYRAATLKTVKNLRTIAASPVIQEASRLSLLEIEAVSEQIAQIVPAGNVPGVILSGLAHLSGSAIPRKSLKRDIDLLWLGTRRTRRRSRKD